MFALLSVFAFVSLKMRIPIQEVSKKKIVRTKKPVTLNRDLRDRGRLPGNLPRNLRLRVMVTLGSKFTSSHRVSIIKQYSLIAKIKTSCMKSRLGSFRQQETRDPGNCSW